VFKRQERVDEARAKNIFKLIGDAQLDWMNAR